MNRLFAMLFAFVYLSKSANAQSKANATFECDFEKDTCGLVNDDHNVPNGSKWVRKFMDLGGRKGNVMLLETGFLEKPMGRLLTPFFHRKGRVEEGSTTLYRRGMLSLDLYTAGDGFREFWVEQQDNSGVHPHLIIYRVKNETPKWSTITLHDLASRYDIAAGVYVRFILEAYVNRNLGGTVVAIDNISFTQRQKHVRPKV